MQISHLTNGPPSRRKILAVIAVYILFSAGWLVLSDNVLPLLFSDPNRIIQVGMLNGWLLVGVTSWLLYTLMRRWSCDEILQTKNLNALNLLTAIADSSDDAIFAKDLAGRYILFNQAACNFIGKSVEDVLGRDDRAFFPPEQAEMLMALGRQVIAENRSITEEERIETVAGPCTFLATKGPLRDDQGNIIGIFGISRDITERKLAETALRQSEERLQLALDATRDGLWDWDLRTGRAYLSPYYYEMTGYRPEEIVADFEFFKHTVYPDDLPRVLAILQAHIQGKTPTCEYEYRLLSRSGELKWMKGRGRIVERDAEGVPLRMIGTTTDINVRKGAEELMRRQAEELAQRNDELERVNRAMIDRELDMIALKQRVNELSHQLGREPPYTLAFLDTPPAQQKQEHSR